MNHGSIRTALRIIAVTVAVVCLSLIEFRRPDVIDQVTRILSRFTANP